MVRIKVVIAGLADRGRIATAFLLLLVSAQLCWAADPGPEQEHGQGLATAPSQSSTGGGSSPLAQMAEEVLGDYGLAAPPIATSDTLSVTAVVPANGAVDVPVSTNITVTFSEEVDPTTVTTTWHLIT